MSKKKKIFIGIGSIILIMVALIALFVVRDLKQEDTLKKELTRIDEMIDFPNVDVNKVNDRLNNTVTKGDYQKVEKAFKNYYRDYLNSTVKITTILEDEQLFKVVSIDNYKKDGPNFTKTTEYISNARNVLTSELEKMNKYLNHDEVMKYVTSKTNDEYYVNLYKEFMPSKKELDDYRKDINESVNGIIGLLNKSDDVIKFLITNKESWTIENDGIVFNSSSLSNQYKELLSLITSEES